jgi:hypothetical protein
VGRNNSGAKSYRGGIIGTPNPIIYAMSHPKYREALTKELPCLGIEELGDDNATIKETVKTEKA